MKTGIALLAVCLLVPLAAVAAGNDKNIVVQVDKFTGKTMVSMKEISLGQGFTNSAHPNDLVGIYLSAFFSPGPNPTALVITCYSSNWQFLGGADVRLLVDGERIDLGHFAKMKGNVDRGVVTDTIAGPVSRSVFEKIAGAKIVEMQFGTYETKLKDKCLDRVRAFVAALPVESAVK
jgi:hypothetical protein